MIHWIWRLSEESGEDNLGLACTDQGLLLGGTALSGGRGGVIGTLLGAYLISLVNNLLNFMDVSKHY